ncbi:MULTISPECIES: DUF397 domain-containing protein [Actinomadura]|uniref:DUF397 domain-containing protein n=1 Tax=Actinomadura yumaensis TaxID=111807 RepID=A0ABW2CYT2_9ACTN|nr:DUF397 domain-containing protein [Actinomadura sp. J1-007]MWK37261.1 DUF397 domain-containing protein [Actinomadura sp. J1-007]
MTEPKRASIGATWRKSSHSGSGDQCVEVASLSGGLRAVRDSKDPDGPAIVLRPGALRAFVDSVRES